jgi:glycosyltransferase involved in cell wall biosynthesis
LGRRTDISKIMPGLDLLVSSSIGEAFPSVLGEAMACGIPCVATDAGDSGLIIGEAGTLVPAGDPVLLAKGICDFIKLSPKEKKLMGLKARERIIKLFNLPDITTLYENLYLQTLRRS